MYVRIVEADQNIVDNMNAAPLEENSEGVALVEYFKMISEGGYWTDSSMSPLQIPSDDDHTSEEGCVGLVESVENVAENADEDGYSTDSMPPLEVSDDELYTTEGPFEKISRESAQDPTSKDLQNCFSDRTKETDYVFFNMLDDNKAVSPQIKYQLRRSNSAASSNNEHFYKAYYVGRSLRVKIVRVRAQQPNCNDEERNVCQRNGQAFSSAGYSKPRENGGEGRITRSVKKEKELPSVATTIQTSDSVPKKVRGVSMQDSPPFSCNICDRIYYYKSSWTRHEKKHILKPFLCPKCKKSFAKKSCLIAHQATHTELKPNKCAICEARFKHNHTKLKHERYMHTEVACFQCAVCGKMFNHRNSIIQHLRVHSDQKPLRCQTCGNSFPSKSQLASHQRRHSREKNFQCRICHQRFKYIHNKTKHERLHVEGSRFECALCGRKYRTKSNLVRHIHISRNCN